MNDPGFGKIITGEAQRDAVHVAVAPVTAGQTFQPGEHVGLDEGGQAVRHAPVGIVDPFLKAPVRKGERFWLFLYPGSITSLRHEWTHPAFGDSDPGETPNQRARKRIEEIAAVLDLTYNALMEAAKRWVDYGGYTTEFGAEHWRDTFPAYAEEFWRHYEILTGKAPEARENFFSCSC